MQEGETVFNEGDAGDLFYIILSGEVEILKASKVPVEMPPEVDGDQWEM